MRDQRLLIACDRLAAEGRDLLAEGGGGVGGGSGRRRRHFAEVAGCWVSPRELDFPYPSLPPSPSRARDNRTAIAAFAHSQATGDSRIFGWEEDDEPLARTPTIFAFSLSSSPLLEPSLPFAQRLLAWPGLSLSRSRHAHWTGHSRALPTSRTRPRLHVTSPPDSFRAPRTLASTITQGHPAFAPPRTVSGPNKTRFRRWHDRRTSPVGYHAFVSLSARGSR